MGYYSRSELSSIGLKGYGENVLISDKASFYSPGTIEIGNNVRIDDFCILSGTIVLGNFIHIAPYTAFYGGEKGIYVKDFSNFSSKVSVYAISDDYSGETLTNPMVPNLYKNVQQHAVFIEKHCIFGCGCVILPGVTVGEGVAFGSLSLINKSCEAWSIYAGIPCRKIRERSKDLLQLETKLHEDLNSI